MWEQTWRLHDVKLFSHPDSHKIAKLHLYSANQLPTIIITIVNGCELRNDINVLSMHQHTIVPSFWSHARFRVKTFDLISSYRLNSYIQLTTLLAFRKPFYKPDQNTNASYKLVNPTRFQIKNHKPHTTQNCIFSSTGFLPLHLHAKYSHPTQQQAFNTASEIFLTNR